LSRLIGALLVVVVVAGCGVKYVAPPRPLATLPPPTATPGPQRGEAAGNVECSKASAAGTYGLFGAPAPAFNSAHAAQPLLIRCSNAGKVIALQMDLVPAMTAANALAAARRQLPTDLKLVYDHTQATCRDLQFQSATLASVLGPDDPDGAVNVELDSTLQYGFRYRPDAVDTVAIHQLNALNSSAPCLRGT